VAESVPLFAVAVAAETSRGDDIFFFFFFFVPALLLLLLLLLLPLPLPLPLAKPDVETLGSAFEMGKNGEVAPPLILGSDDAARSDALGSSRL
tara:strand:+ start:251 stop:529 length:279 start_codon:yes stop_codon:yes gene_type:complete